MESPSQNANHFPWKLTLGFLLLAAAVFSPVLSSGWEGDDSLNSLMGDRIRLQHESVIQLTLDTIRAWIFTTGRFFPVALISSVTFPVLLPHLGTYKACMLCMTVGNLALFAAFIRQVTGRTSLAMASVLMAPGIMQMRYGHDAQMSYYGLLQFTMFFLTGSLILLLKYNANPRRRYLLGAVTLYGLSLLTYEITYPFCILHVLLLRHCAGATWRQSLRRGGFFVALAGAGAIGCILLRAQHSGMLTAESPYVPRFDAARISLTLVKEMMASVPLTYFAFDPHLLFSPMRGYVKAHVSFLPVLLFAGYIVAAYELFAQQRREEQLSARSCRGLMGFGFTWWVFASILIALSPKYQSFSARGNGYLNVYLGNFGALLLAVLALSWVLQRGRRSASIDGGMRALFAVGIASIGVFQWTCNSMMVDRQAFFHQHARSVVEQALQQGLLQDVPANAYIYVDNDNLWDNLPFYHARSPHGLHGVSSQLDRKFLQQLDPRGQPPPSADDSIYYLRYAAASADQGYVMLAPATQLEFGSQQEVLRARGSKVRLFVKHPFYGSKEAALVGYRYEGESSQPFQLFANALQMQRRDSNWQLFAAEGDFDLMSLFAAEPGYPPRLSRSSTRPPS